MQQMLDQTLFAAICGVFPVGV